uniref:SPASM domain-containing protein n=2 Tax=Treponema pedis TaxID=409322 RepID=UPI0004948B0C
LYDLGVSDFQITLDGVKEEHDRRRSVVFKSFDKIVENIILINKLGGIVYILHVFDESNINSGKKLVDYFDEISNIHSLSKNTIYFNFVVTIPKKTELVKCNSYVYGKEKYLTKEGVDNAVYALSKGFNIVNTLEISCCFRQLGNSFLVTPDLKLYKCYSTFGNKKYSIETIENISYNEFANKYSLEMMYSDGFSKKCEHCNFVPFCRGGCQFAASEENNGQYGYPFCEKVHMQEQLKGFILNNIYR